jgi:CheY-like chemotaxis protein
MVVSGVKNLPKAVKFNQTMRILTFFSISFLVLSQSYILFAQEGAQSLHVFTEQIERETDPTARLEMTILLAEKMLAEKQVADADYFAQMAVQSATKLSQKLKKATALDLRGEVCRARFDYTNALTWFAEAQELRQTENDQRGIARSMMLTGQVLLDQKETDKAEHHLSKALEIYTQESNITGQAETHQLLGELFLEKKIFGSAQGHIRSAIDLFVEIGDHGAAADLANRLGKFAFEIGDSEGALVYFRQSFNLHVGSEDKPGMAQDFLDLGKVLVATQQYGEGGSQLDAALVIYAELRDTIGMAESMLCMAQLQGGGKAESLQKVQELLDKIQIGPKVPGIYRSLSDAYAKLGNTNMAFVAMQKFVQSQEAMGEIAKRKELIELDMRYQSEIAENTRRRTIEQLETKQTASQRMSLALLAVIGFGIMAISAMWKAKKRKQIAHAQLLEKNTEIENANNTLNTMNTRLDDINQKLVHEIAEREMLEHNVFEKDKFLAMVSREMKQPLQQIIRATTQLSENGPRQLSVSELNEMQFSANNLLVFINDMLDYNHIETGKLQLESILFDPSLIFNEIRERFAAQYKEKGIVFRMEYDSALPTQLSGDPVRLNQVITKTLQYLPVNEENNIVTLSIMHGRREKGDLEMIIQMRGLNCSRLKNLQSSFHIEEEIFMLEEESERACSFSLTMVQRLVGIQKGTIQVNDTDDEVEINLPFKLEPVIEKATKLTREAIESVFHGKTILVVEDNKINQLVVCNLLKAHGATVITANDGLEGVAQMAANDIDLVLMDIQLPELDGYRATAEIRKMPEKAKNSVSIVALTASAYLTDKDKAELFQMNEYIGKPFSPEELLEKVVAILGRTSLQKSLF